MNWLKEFTNPILAEQLYTQAFPLVDVTVIPDDEIMQHKRIALLELVQKHIRQRDMLEFIEKLGTLLSRGYTTDKQVRSLMSYMLQVGETNNLEVLIGKLTTAAPEYEKTRMTIAEQLRRQGEARCLELGETKGRQEGIQKMANNMLLKGIDSQTIMSMTGLTVKELALLAH